MYEYKSVVGSSVVERSVWSVECRGFESHLRQLIFSRKNDCLGCAVLLCLVVCLTLLASFFLPSHLSFKNMYYVTACVLQSARHHNTLRGHHLLSPYSNRHPLKSESTNSVITT